MVDVTRSPRVKVGDRVRLIEMGGDPDPVPPGTLGTVWAVDALGTVHVRWDAGREGGSSPSGIGTSESPRPDEPAWADLPAARVNRVTTCDLHPMGGERG
jgi:hypothetical protein